MKPIVIKIGGSLVRSGHAPTGFWESVALLRRSQPVVLVHGGGPQATEMARRLGHEPRVVHGRRVTTDLDLQIIKWTLCGAVNTDLVADARRCGLEAFGMTGADGGTIEVVRRPPWTVDGESVDFGWVGDIVDVRPKLLEAVLEADAVPVVGALGIDAAGQVFNVNADTVAGGIAGVLGAAALLLATDSGGLARSPLGERVSECTRDLYEEGVAEGWITGGMRVKMTVAFEALTAGVGEVFIVGPGDLVDRASGTRVLGGGA